VGVRLANTDVWAKVSLFNEGKASNPVAYTILPNCTACGDCAQICPNHAIFTAVKQFQISPLLCTECVGYADVPQCAAVCPADAILCIEEAAFQAAAQTTPKYT
jgi:ferredoxin